MDLSLSDEQKQLQEQVGRLLDEFRPAECRNYFRHCGYTATNS